MEAENEGGTVRWTNRVMGAACLAGMVIHPVGLAMCLGLCGVALWKSRGGMRDW